ncbi:MAG TPA: hypothetical protein VIK89_13320, partial [Cytophagaceae bacterium]
MKIHKIVLVLLFTTGLTCSGSIAQNVGTASMEEEQVSTCNNIMLQRLNMQTSRMKEILNLSEEQEQQILRINQKALADLELAKAELKDENRDFDKRLHRIESKRDYQLQNVLSRDQFQKYKSIKSTDSVIGLQMYKELPLNFDQGAIISYQGHPRASDNEEAIIQYSGTAYASIEDSISMYQNANEGLASADTIFHSVC